METQIIAGHRRGTDDLDDPTTIISVDDGRRIAYAEFGREDGVPVLFFHGTPGSRLLGSLFEQHAEDHGIRLLTFDRPGYGRSASWPTRSVSDARLSVDAVLDHADVRTANFVAFSGGAPYALATAATNPALVDRIDVVSGATPPTISNETPVLQQILSSLASRMPSLLGGLFRGQAWLASRLGPDAVVSQYTAADNAESIPDDVASTVKRDFLEAFACRRRGAITEFRHNGDGWDFGLDAIDAAVHLWHGEDDTNVPIGDVRRFESQFPAARLRVLEEADHLQALLESVPAVLEDYR